MHPYPEHVHVYMRLSGVDILGWASLLALISTLHVEDGCTNGIKAIRYDCFDEDHTRDSEWFSISVYQILSPDHIMTLKITLLGKHCVISAVKHVE